MRKLLLVLCFVALSISANAQFFFSVGIGLRFARGTTAGLQSSSWQNGYYFDKTGKKVPGIFKNYLPGAGLLGVSGDDLTFKTDSNAKKQNIKVANINSFVINYESGLKDSFIVSHSALVAKSPVVRLLVNNPVKIYGLLYTYSNQYNYGAKERYYYGPDADNLTAITEANFADVIKKTMNDKDQIMDGLNNREYKLGKMDDLIEYYTLDAPGHITWHQGHYYDTTGTVVKGFFAKNIVNGFVAGIEGRKLLFKVSPAAEPVRLNAGDLRAFLVTDSIHIDSFVVNHSAGFEKTPFLKVINNQELKMYNSSIEEYKGKVRHKYYFGKTPDEVTELNSKNFSTAMTEAFADSPQLVKMIKSKKVGYHDRDRIFTYFRTGIWYEPPPTNY